MTFSTASDLALRRIYLSVIEVRRTVAESGTAITKKDRLILYELLDDGIDTQREWQRRIP